jgi:hypothetical protein
MLRIGHVPLEELSQPNVLHSLEIILLSIGSFQQCLIAWFVNEDFGA